MSKVGIISFPNIERISMTKEQFGRKQQRKNLRFHCYIAVYINTDPINFGAFSRSLVDCVRWFFVVLLWTAEKKSER
jgi:hypothetical protein